MKFETLEAVRDKSEKGYTLPSSRDWKVFLPKSRITDKSKVSFYNELHMLLSSGIELSKAILLIRDQETKKNLSKVYKSIDEGLTRGKSFGETMEEAGGFTSYEIYSIKAGEETRTLALCINNLEKYFSRRIQFKRQLISLISYPSFVIFITVFVLYFMLSYVVPMFSTIFRQFGSELPGMTKFVIELSNVFDTLVLSLILFSLGFYFLHRFLKKKNSYNYLLGNLILKIPVIGDLVNSLNLLKFSELMCLLLKARIPLIEALEMANKTTTFYLLRENLLDVKNKVEKGYSLHTTLDTRIFNKKIITLISIGEEVNQLDNVFENLSGHLNNEIDFKIKMIGKVMEPLILVIISVIVGFILIAMYYPMFTLSRVITN